MIKQNIDNHNFFAIKKSGQEFSSSNAEKRVSALVNTPGLENKFGVN